MWEAPVGRLSAAFGENAARFRRRMRLLHGALMSAAAEYPPPGNRVGRQRAFWAALLPALLLSFVCLAWTDASEGLAASRARQRGTPLKFDPPPVDIDTPPAPADVPPARPDAEDAPDAPNAPDMPAQQRQTAPAPNAPPASNAPSAPAAPGDAAKPIRLFGTVEFRSPLKNLPKWERVRNLEQKKPSFVPSGMDTRNKTVSDRWRVLRDKLQDAPLMEKLKGVNNFFNQWPYKTDIEIWGVEDYWETPREFVERSGDCEDYAISKYYALRELGLPPETLRIVAVKDSIRNLGHAVLAVFIGDDAYVLDNLTGLILSHKRLTHYKPQFSVNENTLWRHIQPQSGPTR